jgi:hypothetical protein
MKQREVIAGLGSAMAWPVVARERLLFLRNDWKEKER